MAIMATYYNFYVHIVHISNYQVNIDRFQLDCFLSVYERTFRSSLSIFILNSSFVDVGSNFILRDRD